MKYLFGLAALFVCAIAGAQELGHWIEDSNHLPAFSYDAPLPYTCEDAQVKIDSNPWWILGNYRITVFAHADGEYEIISGERAWARLNMGEDRLSGANDAVLTIGRKTYDLVGKGSLAENPQICTRVFGCGYATYTYRIGDVILERTMRVSPSMSYDGGDAAVVISYNVKNNGKNTVKLTYRESVLANYAQIVSSPARFVKSGIHVTGETAVVDFEGTVENPLDKPAPEQISQVDAYAPSMYLHGKGIAVSDSGEMSVQQTVSIKAGASHHSDAVVGFMFNASDSEIVSVCERNLESTPDQWLKVLPSFPDEKDRTLAQEMIWHAYTLEAMATYSSYYKETKIPQGTAYDYMWGQHASARDNYQHGLAPIYYNPELARSILRYMAGRTTPWGEIELVEYGYGHADRMYYSTSDQQLFFFQMLAEYLRVTSDYSFLDTEIKFYPGTTPGTMLDVAEQCFDYLRNIVGVGGHGLVKLLNSDWNDCIFVMNKVYYNGVYTSAESHMNTTMALTILPNLVQSLDKYSGPQSAKAQILSSGIKVYRNNLMTSFLKDLGDATFSKRMYFDGKSIGHDQMWLEPQGYLLQVEDFPLERRKTLYSEMQERLYRGEKIGARQQEKPITTVPSMEPGSRENGGVWYSLNGPAICGVATFDKEEALRLVKQMSFRNNAKSFPEFWTSYYSSADNIESSLMGPIEGLADQSGDWYLSPVFCAHPHAWLLYCYYKANE